MNPKDVLDTVVRNGSCVVYPWNRRSLFKGWRDTQALINLAKKEGIFSISYVRGAGEETRPCAWWRADGIRITTDMKQICRRYNNAMRATAEGLWRKYFEPEVSRSSHKDPYVIVSIPKTDLQSLSNLHDLRNLANHVERVARRHGINVFLYRPGHVNSLHIKEDVPSETPGLRFAVRVR